MTFIWYDEDAWSIPSMYEKTSRPSGYSYLPKNEHERAPYPHALQTIPQNPFSRRTYERSPPLSCKHLHKSVYHCPPDERIWTASVQECPLGRTDCTSSDAFSLS